MRSDGVDRQQPAERLRARLAGRYDWSLGFDRRWERPDREDPRNLAILLRQAADAHESAVLRCLGPTLTRHLGEGAVRTLADAQILRRLATKHTSSCVQLAEFLARSPATVSRSLDRLEAAGLVERGEAWDDGRCKHVTLTEEGHLVADELDAVIDDTLDLVGDDIDVEAMRTGLVALAVLADLR